MGPVFWVLVAGLGVAGYFGYRKLSAMERELRREVAEEKEAFSREKGKRAEGTARRDEKAARKTAEESGEGPAPLEERLLDRIREKPGILQTELYGHYPEENRRTVQEVLRKLDRAGRLARTRERGTYRLYPVQ